MMEDDNNGVVISYKDYAVVVNQATITRDIYPEDANIYAVYNMVTNVVEYEDSFFTKALQVMLRAADLFEARTTTISDHRAENSNIATPKISTDIVH